MAIYVSGQPVCLREVVLSDKPAQLLQASAKGTVPVLVLPNGNVLEQSLDIMQWALECRDPDNYLISDAHDKQQDMFALIRLFDEEFKVCLQDYRSAKRYHDDGLIARRVACERFLQMLEKRLLQHQYLFSDNACVADLAIIPFIRQFSRVERQWYLASPYPNVRDWLNRYLQNRMFSKVMVKYPAWLAGSEMVIYAAD